MNVTRPDENLAYHAARLLILLRRCGTPRAHPGVKGRTLLAKLDFFLRYPAFLRKAAAILQRQVSLDDLGVTSESELDSVESRMVRYHYGPWDHVYYPVLAYLIGKGLLRVDTKSRVEVFSLTPEGQQIADSLLSQTEYSDLARRADLTYALFSRFGGSRLKEFIYQNFPHVVGLELNQSI